MGLFDTGEAMNILPYDGTAIYFGKILEHSESHYFFDKLLKTIEWRNDEAIIFGKHFITKRKAAWYGDENYAYTYSNTTKYALSWTEELIELKKRVEKISGASFNSCLLNLYHNGAEGMSWHSDDEKTLENKSTIASLSFGAERNFSFKHKRTKHSLSITLENGSLLLMKGATQENWLHALPKSKKINRPRINLTFRSILHSQHSK